jgi:hypothetical protein
MLMAGWSRTATGGTSPARAQRRLPTVPAAPRSRRSGSWPPPPARPGGHVMGTGSRTRWAGWLNCCLTSSSGTGPATRPLAAGRRKVPSRRPAGARPAACRQTAAVPHHSCRTHAASVAGASAVSPAPAPRHPASRLPARHTVLPAGRAERRGHHDPREADIRHSRPRIRRVNTDYLSRAKPLAATPEPATAT